MDMASFVIIALSGAALYVCRPTYSAHFYESYIVDNSTAMSQAKGALTLLMQISLIWLGALTVRGIADAANRRIGGPWFSIIHWLLDCAYIAGCAYAFTSYAFVNASRFTAFLPGGVYEPIHVYYTLPTLIITCVIAATAIIIRLAFKHVASVRPPACGPYIENVFTAVSMISLAVAAHSMLRAYMYLDYARICALAILAAISYFGVSVLRGIILGLVKGDVIGAIFTRPPLSLLERYRLFAPGLTFAERTGLSIRSMWSIKFALRLIPTYALICVILTLGMTCVYTIEPDQQALVYRFGKMLDNPVATPGLHLKLPWPIDRLGLYSTERVKSLVVGYVPSGGSDFLWTSEHGGYENMLLLGNGNELIAINISVKYTISDVVAYAVHNAIPEWQMDANVYKIMLGKTVSSNLDAALNTDRRQLSEDLRDRMNEFARDNNLGVYIENVVISSIHPPIELADVYQGVVSASVRKQTLITNAQADARKSTLNAQQRGETAVLQASTTQTQKLSLIRRDMAVYESAYAAHLASPECYEFLRKLKAAKTAIENQRVYAFSPKAMENLDRFIVTNGLPLLPSN
jgi:regulator of protease activity HflC (stomatin/prohibitin superfamily)